MNLDGDYAVSVAGNKQLNVDIGKILLDVRTAAKLTARGLSSMIDASPATISRLEKGSRNADPEVVRQWLTACNADAATRSHVLELVEESRQSPWVAMTVPDHRRQAEALMRAEETATHIVAWSPEVVSGPLQDEAYTRALMARAGMSSTLVERQLAHRKRRKEIILDGKRAKYRALLGESALIRRIGGTEVLANQLRSLLAVSKLPHVDLRVVPLETDWHGGLDGSFVLIKGTEGALVHASISGSALIFDRPRDIKAFERTVEEVLNVAMTPADTARVINSRLELLS